MLSDEMERFYKRWKKKANGYNISELEGCFDKFITLFIVYNFLFNKVDPRRIGDKIKATEKVLSCIEAEYLNQELFKNEKTGEAFANLIEKKEDFSFIDTVSLVRLRSSWTRNFSLISKMDVLTKK